jgi:hypothetical protein
MEETKQHKLIAALLLEATRLRYGRLKVSVVTEFEVSVHDGQATAWEVVGAPRLSIKDIT